MKVARSALVVAVILVSLVAYSQTPKTGVPVSLPVSYEGHRFYVVPVTTSGVSLRFYTDSGGGLFILPEAVKNAGLKTHSESGMEIVDFPPFQSGKSIPPALGKSYLPVFTDKAPPHMENLSGMLGQEWFGGRTWTWGYKEGTLLWRADGDVPKNPDHTITLGFQTDSNGKRSANVPRITITVEGQSLDVLFDTGATTYLKPEALKNIGDGGPVQRATSFMAQETLDSWHKNHPDWKYVDDAEDPTGQPMIQAPEITVAGYKVGPVWFTRRPDGAFHKFMTQFMDKQVEGALGGSGLQYFRITVDYPNAVAVFERP
ncbi:MAG TPA: hypothetical protein VG897_02335 [Terriglobales bacterium]|nr:hypothetical protein [Terriglobales bacterium]